MYLRFCILPGRLDDFVAMRFNKPPLSTVYCYCFVSWRVSCTYFSSSRYSPYYVEVVSSAATLCWWVLLVTSNSFNMVGIHALIASGVAFFSCCVPLSAKGKNN